MNLYHLFLIDRWANENFTFFDDIILVNQSTGKVIDSSNLNINRFNYAAGKKLSANIYDKDGNITGPAKVDVNAPISGVVISGQEISNKSYYCYTKEIYVGGNPYYLTGLISQDNYNSQVRSVSIWVVVITFIFMVFIIQVLPIVKLFLMNSKDRLKSTDLMWSGISLVFWLSALVLLYSAELYIKWNMFIRVIAVIIMEILMIQK